MLSGELLSSSDGEETIFSVIGYNRWIVLNIPETLRGP